jgi:hypothetical protein
MNGILISFCNVSPPDFVLGAYNYENDRFHWIETASLAPGSGGATGIAAARGHYWVVKQAIESSIVRLDAEFKPAAVYSLPASRDAHSLVPFDDGFLIADTLRNCVNFARLTDDGSAIVEAEFWRHCPADDKDEAHVNSICQANGEVYVSLFGEKPASGWQSSQKGKILNITTGEVICGDLQHPHTLVLHRGDIYWLESKAGLLHKYTPGGKHEVILHLNGYVRGLLFDDEFIYIGASAVRRKSRSTGTLNQLASGNPDDYHCWIYRVSQHTGAVQRRSLTGFGAEIYDLYPIPFMPREASEFSSAYALAGRLWRIEDDRAALQKRLEDCHNELLSSRAEHDQLNHEFLHVRADLDHVLGTVWWRLRATARRFLRR